jgi:hypothetical protein
VSNLVWFDVGWIDYLPDEVIAGHDSSFAQRRKEKKRRRKEDVVV